MDKNIKNYIKDTLLLLLFPLAMVGIVGSFMILHYIELKNLDNCDRNMIVDNIEEAYRCCRVAQQIDAVNFHRHQDEILSKMVFLDSCLAVLQDTPLRGVNVQVANVRQKANKQAKIVCQVEYGENVRIEEQVNAKWAKITTEQGKQGYIYTENLLEQTRWNGKYKRQYVYFVYFIPLIWLLVGIVIGGFWGIKAFIYWMVLGFMIAVPFYVAHEYNQAWGIITAVIMAIIALVLFILRLKVAG